eukprot:16227-Karenia_brevis.AAC.1
MYDYGSKILFANCCGGVTCGSVVDQYKHLGTIYNTSNNMGPEIKHRVGKFLCCLKPLRQNFFNRRDISHDRKLYVLQSVMFAGILFQSGTWPQLNSGEYSKLHAPMMRAYRSVCADPYYDRWESDEAMLQRCNLAAPINLLRAMRFCLCARVITQGNAVVKCALSAASLAQRSWLRAVE